MTSKATTRRRRAKTRYPGVTITDRANGQTVYEIWYTGSDKRPHWETVDGSIEEAVARRGELSWRKQRGETVVPTPRDLTFAAAAEAFMASCVERERSGSLRPNTIAAYRTALDVHAIPRFGEWRLDQIDVNAISKLLSEMATTDYRTAVQTRLGYRKPQADKGYAAWTISGALVAIKCVYAHARRRLGFGGADPTSLLERHERPRHEHRTPNMLTREQLARVIECATTSTPTELEREPFREAIMLGGRLGLRLGEVLGLIWSDVDLTPGRETVRVTAQLDAKTHTRVKPKTKSAYRTVEVEAEVAHALRALRMRSLHSTEPDYVLNVNGAPLKRRAVQRRGLLRAQQTAGIEQPVVFHALRHGHGSALISDGRDIAKVSRRLGHASVNVTMAIYTHEYESTQRSDDFRAQLDRLYQRDSA